MFGKSYVLKDRLYKNDLLSKSPSFLQMLVVVFCTYSHKIPYVAKLMRGAFAYKNIVICRKTFCGYVEIQGLV